MVVTVHIPTITGGFVHVPTLTCGLTLINPYPLTLICVFALNNPLHCIECNCLWTSPHKSLPLVLVYLHIPLWVGKSLPTHSPIVCLTITHIFCNLSSVRIIHCSQVSVQNGRLTSHFTQVCVDTRK